MVLVYLKKFKLTKKIMKKQSLKELKKEIKSQIKAGDMVIILSGKYEEKKGKCISAINDTFKILIKGRSERTNYTITLPAKKVLLYL